ncbi:MAG: type II secretion system protein [Candidatus Gastranaerophilaceae bacterium]
MKKIESKKVKSVRCRSFHWAFTLSDVLITLGIIAVIAVMVIPALNNYIQDIQYKTAYKKAYSALYQALTQANGDNALEYASGSYDPVHSLNFKTIMSYLKLQKTCYDYDSSECWYKDGEEYNSSSYSNGYPCKNDLAVVDASGMDWALYASGFIAMYFVDTNGFKKPNQWGKDRFCFYLPDINGNVKTGIPIKIVVYENDPSACLYNKCGTVGDKDYKTFYSESWLYNYN